MEDITYADEWFSIQETVKEDFLLALKKEEVIELIKVLHIKIPGFNRNFQKAPPKILKNQLKRKILQLPDLRDFLKVFTMPYSKDYEDLEKKELLKKLAANNEITESQIIALISMSYPDHYMKLRKQMMENMERERHLLESLVEYSLIDALEQLPNPYLHFIDEVKEQLQEDNETISQETFNLKNYRSYFLKDYNIGIAPALQVIFHNDDLEDSLPLEEELAFYRLALLELIHHFQDKTKELTKETKQLHREMEKTMKLLNEEKKSRKQLTNELSEKEGQISRLKNSNHQLNEKLQKARTEILRFEEQIKQELEHLLLQKSDSFLLFSHRGDEFKNYVHPSKLKKIEELKSYIEQHSTSTVNIFIDGYLLSTSEKLQLADISKAYSGYSTLLNGSVSNMLKKIIYLLEGENTNETYEEINR